MAQSHLTIKFAVNETTRLSMSHWFENAGKANAYRKDSVALEIKRGNTWELQHDSCCEIRGKDDEDSEWRATDCAVGLVASVLGECPFRFFSTNCITAPRPRGV